MENLNVTQKLIRSHLVSGHTNPQEEIGIKIDQTLTQDATGTLVMLELEAMGLNRAKTEISVQYVDHNLIQEDHKNADDHLYLLSACQKYGIWFSRPGNGVSHPIHQEKFGKPGKTLLGSDSHTPAAGAIGMLAIGAGGLEVALAIAGEPFFFKMPEILGVHLTGKLPNWVSAKDVILEMLRRYNVSGGLGKIIEYYGPGLETLSAMDRHVIANMGAELGATTSVFPSDIITKQYLREQGRESDWIEIKADSQSKYDLHDKINLSKLVPLIAMPSSPGNVVTVASVQGQKIYQSYIGSSANPGFRDFAVTAEMVKNKKIPSHVSFDINPASRQTLEQLVDTGYFSNFIRAGGRIHQVGCNGCIGMGQAPATKEYSLRTVPRNFLGRSGTKEDKVCLVSPETATASALTGFITDPRSLKMIYPELKNPANEQKNVMESLFDPPLDLKESQQIQLRKGPNITNLPKLSPCLDLFNSEVLLKLGDDISTDTIMPAGLHVLPFRSNIQKISEFAFEDLSEAQYFQRATKTRETTGHLIVAGWNYGQGSSREHAALALRYLGLHAVFALSFARIHRQNLINFGVLPFQFENESDYKKISVGDHLEVFNIQSSLRNGTPIFVSNVNKNETYKVTHELSTRQIDIFLQGGIVNWLKNRMSANNVLKAKAELARLESKSGGVL